MSLDPELAALMHHLAGVASVPDLVRRPGGAARLDAFCGGLLPYSPPDVQIREWAVHGPNGPVKIRVYGGDLHGGSGKNLDPTAANGVPALVWMHGGNFALGDLDMRESDQFGREVAARSGGLVVCVDYRLALGGVHFPVPHEDVLAAWHWVVDHAAELGADPARLCLGGASAGANLAVGAALYLKDAGSFGPAKLVLAYPFLHGSLPDNQDEAFLSLNGLPPFLRFSDVDCLTMVENYVGGPLNMASSYAMPGYADPAGLPPTAILAGGYDNLRFSAEQFAKALINADIKVTFRLEAGAIHGYLNHSAALSIVRDGLQYLADQMVESPTTQASGRQRVLSVGPGPTSSTHETKEEN
jgi:acetyl esterase/lipase